MFLPNISSLQDDIEEDFSSFVGLLRDMNCPLYVCCLRNERCTSTSISMASSDYEYDGGLGSVSMGDRDERSSVLSNHIIYSNVPASQSAGSRGREVGDDEGGNCYILCLNTL